jgi:chromate transporter
MIDNSLKNIFKYFLKLGVTGFGGPLALIQQMRLDLVENSTIKDNIINEKDFDQAFTMIKAMPGPAAFQMAVYLGQKTGKFRGGLLAGLGIIAPAFLMMLVLAFYYDAITQNKYLSDAMLGAQYAVAGIILVGLYKLSKMFHKKILFWGFLIFAAVSFYFKLLPETFLILGTGITFVLINVVHQSKNQIFGVVAFPVIVTEQEKIISIFKICFKTGALVFGTGLAAFPFLESAFVSQLGWLDLKTFNAAVSFGQMTPGPVTISAAFMGFKMASLSGAIAATCGLYLPSFIHMTTWFPKALNWLSKQKWIDQFIFGSTAAVVGCVLTTVINMNKNDFSHFSFWIIFLGSVAVQFKFKNISVLKIIFGGAFLRVLMGLML